MQRLVLPMKLGWCSGSTNAHKVRQAGYDFIELPLAALQLENPDAYHAQVQEILSLSLPTAAFNIFFPRTIKIVGPEAEPNRIKDYVARAAQAVSLAKARIVVLGSGASRHIPECWERERAETQFLETLSVIDAEFKGCGATLVIEPLNRKESNLINSISEAVRMAQLINSPVIQALADVYHMMEENEPLEEIRRHAAWIAHIHVADTGRKPPGEGSFDFRSLSDMLQQMNYQGMVSVECTAAADRFDSILQDSHSFLRKEMQLKEAK
jgi:sugar phosphate isomerase/epimerase